MKCLNYKGLEPQKLKKTSSYKVKISPGKNIWYKICYHKATVKSSFMYRFYTIQILLFFITYVKLSTYKHLNITVRFPMKPYSEKNSTNNALLKLFAKETEVNTTFQLNTGL